MFLRLQTISLIIQPDDWGGGSFISVFDVLILGILIWWVSKLYYTGDGSIGRTSVSQQNVHRYNHTQVSLQKKEKILSEQPLMVKSEEIKQPNEVWIKVSASSVSDVYARQLLFPPENLKRPNQQDIDNCKIIRVPKSLVMAEIAGNASFYVSSYSTDKDVNRLKVQSVSHEIKFIQIHGLELLHGRTLCRGVAFLKNGTTLMETKDVRIEFEYDCLQLGALLPLEIHFKKPILKKYNQESSYGLIAFTADNIGHIRSGKNRSLNSESILQIMFPY